MQTPVSPQPTSPIIHESEAERASNSYLISTVVLVFGLPIPIINMLATGMFYLGNRRQKYFVRFHCLQSMLSQIPVLIINTSLIVWTLMIVFGSHTVSDVYFGFLFTAIIFNIIEFVASIYATVQTRKKKDVRFWGFGELTERLCKPDKE